MSRYKYYVFDYHTNKLGCLDLLGNADDSDFIEAFHVRTRQYYINSRYFNLLSAFLSYLDLLNSKVFTAYVEDFGIQPPYKIGQKHINAAAPCITYAAAKGRTFCFEPTKVPDGRLRLSSIDNFFMSNKDQMFDIGYIIRMHNFIVNSMIVMPGRGYTFHVKLFYWETLDATIEPLGDRYYFKLHGSRNDEIFRAYDIPVSKITQILTRHGFVWRGGWPETDKQTVREIIDYINANYYAADNQFDVKIKGAGIRISGFNISYADHVFMIKQHKNGKWYIDGDTALIVSMFGVSGASELRKFVDKVLGKKFRRGLFPECDSKEEIIKLLNEITKCPT